MYLQIWKFPRAYFETKKYICYLLFTCFRNIDSLKLKIQQNQVNFLTRRNPFFCVLRIFRGRSKSEKQEKTTLKCSIIKQNWFYFAVLAKWPKKQKSCTTKMQDYLFINLQLIFPILQFEISSWTGYLD